MNVSACSSVLALLLYGTLFSWDWLQVLCDIFYTYIWWYLHQDISRSSFKSCKWQGGATMDWTGLSSSSHICFIELRSGEFGDQTLELFAMFFKVFLKISQSLLKEATAVRKYHYHEGMYLVCNSV